MAKIIIVRGCPGSGKSTFVKNMFPNIANFENDQFFYKGLEYMYDKNKIKLAIEWCFGNARNCLKNGVDCIVSNTFTRKTFVNSYVNLAKTYGADFEVYRMMGTFMNIHNVPNSILSDMRTKFEDYAGEIFVYPNENNSDSISTSYSFSNERKAADVHRL